MARVLIVEDQKRLQGSLRRGLTEEGYEVVLVSDRYHSARLEGIADEVGLRAHVSPTDHTPSFMELVKESGKVSVGRLIGYRRVTRMTESG